MDRKGTLNVIDHFVGFATTANETLMLVAGYRSTAIVAIDCHIFLGEVAGEHAVAALAEAERNLHGDFRLFHRGRDRGLIVGRIALPLVRDADAAEPDRQPVTVGRLARLADG